MLNTGAETMWVVTVTLAGSDTPVRVTFDGREGNQVFVREVDPGEPEPGRVELRPGEELVVMRAISHISLHATADQSNDLLFGMRVVPARRQGSVVYARTLRHGEHDTGQRVHIRPSESITFEDGAVVLELDYVDSLEPPRGSGYVPLTPVLASWWSVVQDRDEGKMRYVLAAARRLDVAEQLLSELNVVENRLNSGTLPFSEVRREIFNLIGSIEMAVVALGRALAMVSDAPVCVRGGVATPPAITKAKGAITAIRNAIEHIEDRAFGNVHGRPHSDALDIFDYETLLRTDALVYGQNRLELVTEVPNLLADARGFLKDVARNA